MPKKSKRKVAAKTKPKQVKPIPSGFRTVTPYLVLNDANGAIEFYKKAFGAKELTRNPTPDGKILNAQIKIGDSIVMLSDEFPFPGSTIKSPSSLGASTFTMHIYSKNVDKLWEQAVAAGADGQDAPRQHILGGTLRADRQILSGTTGLYHSRSK